MRSEELKAELEAKETIEWAVFSKVIRYLKPEEEEHARVLKGASKVVQTYNITERITIVTADNNGQAYFNPEYLDAIKLTHPDITFLLSAPSEKEGEDNWSRIIFGKVEEGNLIILAPLSRKHLLLKGEIKRWSAE